MPSYNNAARKYADFTDFDEDYDDPMLTRRTAVAPQYRVAGTTPRPAMPRPTAAIPNPLANGMPRRATMPNLPSPNITPRGGVNTPAPAARPTANRRPVAAPSNSSSTMKLVLFGGAVVCVLVLSYLVVSFAVHTWQTWQDDLTYGRPRITRLMANVGHNEANGAKTLFIAQNINGQISITEYPGGDATKTRVIVGPQLFGKDKDLVPIKLQTKDVNGDGKDDLIATADDQVLIYINDNGNFRPINDQERANLKTQSQDKDSEATR
jgi:hypothetical protein